MVGGNGLELYAEMYAWNDRLKPLSLASKWKMKREKLRKQILDIISLLILKKSKILLFIKWSTTLLLVGRLKYRKIVRILFGGVKYTKYVYKAGIVCNAILFLQLNGKFSCIFFCPINFAFFKLSL